MTHSRVNYRAPLRAGRDRRHGRPEISTVVDARVPDVLFPATIPSDRQFFWQSSPICAALYGNVTHSVVVTVAGGIIHISA
jgi:hypothetical protein